MPGKHVLNDRKSKSGAHFIALVADFDAIKPLGQAGNVLPRDAKPRIFYIEPGTAPSFIPANVDRASRRRVFDGIDDEIGKSTTQLLLDAEQVDVGFKLEVDARLFGAEHSRFLANAF